MRLRDRMVLPSPRLPGGSEVSYYSTRLHSDAHASRADAVSQAERAAVKRRLAADVGQSSRNVHIGPHDVLAVFKDCRSSANSHFSSQA